MENVINDIKLIEEDLENVEKNVKKLIVMLFMRLLLPLLN